MDSVNEALDVGTVPAYRMLFALYANAAKPEEGYPMYKDVKMTESRAERLVQWFVYTDLLRTNDVLELPRFEGPYVAATLFSLSDGSVHATFDEKAFDRVNGTGSAEKAKRFMKEMDQLETLYASDNAEATRQNFAADSLAQVLHDRASSRSRSAPSPRAMITS